MKRIGSKNTKPELIIRKLLSCMGFRYRLHRGKLPGKPDIVFPSKKKVIFVHGCFWHQHSDKKCKKMHIPKSKLDYWLPKLDKTKTRDRKNQLALKQLGWKVYIIWECEIDKIINNKLKLVKFLKG